MLGRKSWFGKQYTDSTTIEATFSVIYGIRARQGSQDHSVAIKSPRKNNLVGFSVGHQPEA
jgi:hypothetical protein